MFCSLTSLLLSHSGRPERLPSLPGEGKSEFALCNPALLCLQRWSCGELGSFFSGSAWGAGVSKGNVEESLHVVKAECILLNFNSSTKELPWLNSSSELGPDPMAEKPKGQNSPRCKNLLKKIRCWLFQGTVTSNVDDVNNIGQIPTAQ